MSNSKQMCHRCRSRLKPDKMVHGALGYSMLCKSCKYQLRPEKDH